MESRIPFTASFPTVLNPLILSYLTKGEIEKIEKMKTENFTEQHYIQKIAKDRKNYMTSDLFNNLALLLQEIPGAKFLESDEKLPNAYWTLCHINKDHLLYQINYAFDENVNLTEGNREFIYDCIMHLAYCFPEDAGKLLNLYIGKTSKTFLIDYLIDHGADVNTRVYDNSSSTLEKAILYKIPSQQIINLIQKELNYKTSVNDFSHSILVFAALYSSLEILIELSKNFPDKMIDSLNKIDEFIKYPWSAVVLSHDLDHDLDMDLHPKIEELKDAKKKLLIILKSDSYNFEKINKDEALAIINEELKATKRIETCFTFYENLSTSQYLNYQRHSYLDNYVLPFFKTSSYTRSKINLIESIQEKIYSILISGEFTHSFAKSFDYYETCKDTLEHAVFAEEHQKNGVGNTFKDLIKNRVDEIEKSLLIKRVSVI